MKKGSLVWNKNAGEGRFKEKELSAWLESKHYDIRFCKRNEWDGIREDDELLIIAGGDGTVRKVIKKLLQRKIIDKQVPVAVLPLGTANNIAKTFYRNTNPIEVISGWEGGATKLVDAGRIDGIKGQPFFIEGIGLGVFPQLIKEAKNEQRIQEAHPRKALHSARELLARIIKDYRPKFCRLEIDGKDHSGDYILIEILNTRSVGPNLHLAPDADPCDGLLDVVMVRADQQQALCEWATAKNDQKDIPFKFQTVRASKIYFEWQGLHLHIDDQLIKQEKGTQVHVEVQKGVLEFYVEETPKAAEQRTVMDGMVA